MTNKQQLLESMLFEMDVARFLGRKVPADRLDWRPTEGQRSLLELLQYLTIAGIRVARVCIEKDDALFQQYEERAGSVRLEDFDEAMAKQADEMRALVNGFSDDAFENETTNLPWGPEVTIAAFFLNASLKFLTAYRMQLFLYLKSMGLSELGTWQAWLGVDSKEELQARFQARAT